MSKQARGPNGSSKPSDKITLSLLRGKFRRYQVKMLKRGWIVEDQEIYISGPLHSHRKNFRFEKVA